MDTGNLFGLLVEFICKKEKIDADIVQTLLSALLHEPCIAHDHVGPFLFVSPSSTFSEISI